jgi:hypothetical protein
MADPAQPSDQRVANSIRAFAMMFMSALHRGGIRPSIGATVAAADSSPVDSGFFIPQRLTADNLKRTPLTGNQAKVCIPRLVRLDLNHLCVPHLVSPIPPWVDALTLTAVQANGFNDTRSKVASNQLRTNSNRVLFDSNTHQPGGWRVFVPLTEDGD